MKKTVLIAEPYRFGALASLGDAAYMLLRQFRFPHEYDTRDTIVTADSDRCFQADYSHAHKCFQEHLHTGEMGLEHWLHTASAKKVIAFLKDILKADTKVEWTGYRVLGTVHRGNGRRVYTVQLFAKHPESDTEVYTGPNAPNVKMVADAGMRMRIDRYW